MAEAGSLMEQGIALARAGRREEAYATLRRVLFTEGDDATLRIWLGGVAPTLQEAHAHLERAVELAPDNAQAVAGLHWIEQQLAAGPPPPPPAAEAPGGSLRRLAPPPADVAPEAASPAPRPAPASPPPVADLPSIATSPAPRPTEPYIPQQLSPRLAARPLDAGAGDQMPAAVGGACPNCGMPANPNDRFCLRCGHSLAAPAAFPLDLAEASLAAEGDTTPWGVRGGESGTIEPTIAPLRSRSLQVRPLDEDAAPHPLQGPPADPTGAPLARPAFAPALPRPASSRRPWLLGALIALLVIVILGSVAVYAFTIRPQQESAADATAIVEAASAGATATVVATATQGAAAEATARREATLAAAPSTTAQAVTDQYLQHIGTIMQQVESQDADIQHTLQGLQDGLLNLDIVEKQFGTFVDQSSDVKNQLAMLYVPGDSRRQHQALTDALTARGQAIVAAQQFVEDLIWLAQAQYQATQAQQALTTAQDLCNQTKVRADCTNAYTAQQTSDSAKNQVDRVQTYVAQSLQEYNRTWAQYKQLMPATTSGDTHQ